MYAIGAILALVAIVGILGHLLLAPLADKKRRRLVERFSQRGSYPCPRCRYETVERGHLHVCPECGTHYSNQDLRWFWGPTLGALRSRRRWRHHSQPISYGSE